VLRATPAAGESTGGTESWTVGNDEPSRGDDEFLEAERQDHVVEEVND
jgi:hypothetical protein